jgi:hypothetical protein
MGFPDDLIHEFDNGGLFIEVGKVAVEQIVLFGVPSSLVEHLFDGFTADAVEAFDGFIKIGQGREAEADALSGREAEGLGKPWAKRIAGGHAQEIVFAFEREHLVLVDGFGGEKGQNISWWRGFVQTEIGQAHRIG